MPRREIFRKALPLAVVVAFLFVGVFTIRSLGRWLSAPDPVRKVDVIVVSAGDPDHRLPVAIDLLKRGMANKVWAIPSGSGPVLRERQAIAAYAKREHVDRGVAV